MNVEEGIRVRTVDIPGRWDSHRFVNQTGTVLKVLEAAQLVYVVMDDPRLHDREIRGVRCCGFHEEDFVVEDHIIEETSDLSEILRP